MEKVRAKSFLEAYQEITMTEKLSELRNTLKKFQGQLPKSGIAQYRKDNQSSVGKGYKQITPFRPVTLIARSRD